ncbi:MAG: DUF1553 domain-containing protein, partial [Planctomycetaceae bacterium]
GLRLDSREELLKGGDSGSALDLEKPTESLLMQALRYESLEMPPKEALPAAVVADFQKWIELGAPDPRRGSTGPTRTIDLAAGRNHWAYQPLRLPKIPVQGPSRSASPIDSFIWARLAAAKLERVPLAKRGVLVRRLYFDLLGLPPTAEQIEAFVSDDGPDAYVRLVDELLASPHFGERWGRHWLDVVRYAESITLRGFVFPEAWRYRDYVIETFNADRPFDRFVREQVSGDLLSDPSTSLPQRRRNLVATTFLTLGNNNLEDQDKGKLQMDVVDEQLETIGRGFLAQTIGCARCHDHKFDPIPTRDYYALAGILKNTKTLNHANVSKWIELSLPLEPEREAELKRHESQVAAVQKQINVLKKKTPGSVAGLSPLKVKHVAGVVVDDLQAEKTGKWTTSQFTKSYIGTGYQHDQGQTKGANTATFRATLPADGEYEVRFAYTPGSNRSPAVPVTVFSANSSQTVSVNQKQRPAIDGRFVSLGRYPFKRGTDGQVRVVNSGTTGVVIIDAVQFLPVELADKPVASTASAPVARNPQQTKRQLSDLERQLKSLKQSGLERSKYMSIQEEAKIEDIQVHIRGNVHNLGATVPRGFLRVIDVAQHRELPTDQSGRKELGAWIGSNDNPLTARVLANRLWHWLFGTGLVATPDNFGTTGQTPSHPRLLDYLASRVLQSNWSIKTVLREMVLSEAYQRSSQTNALSLEADPDNRLLWRMNRRRLDAESLLDAMLMINGDLRRQVGGSLIRSGTANDYDYRHASDRRAVYWPVFRNSLPDIFKVFDFANPSMVTGRRDSSSTAPQALFMMNNPWVIQQAEQAATRLLAIPGNDDLGRAERIVLQTLGRPASSDELRSIVSYVKNGAPPTTRQARWSQVIQSLFASIDFRYID